ncbi:hypothetical protein ABT131_32095 [Streptomyces sp900105245]|uniref:hypothetical protein n=1 Tax=unclassified Streptomyces TaxID=2593676 RepID=UPI003327C584
MANTIVAVVHEGDTLQQAVEIIVALSMTDAGTNHPLVEQAFEEFLADARDVRGLVVEERTASVAGRKGGLSELVLIPGAPSVAWSVVKLIEMWLQRDRNRSIEVVVHQPGQDPHTVRVSGEKVNVEVLGEALRAAVAKPEVEATESDA